MKHLEKLVDRLFSTSAAGLYIILFAVSIGAATFIENDFGTSSAQKIIFTAWWFELLLVLFGISLVTNIFRFRMVQQKKWAILIFHAAMIIILMGAGITRYWGGEGIMHIREGGAANSFTSAETYLQFEAINKGQKYLFDDPVLFATLGSNKLKKSYLLANEKLDVEVVDFMPNPSEVMVNDDSGTPILKIVIGGMNGREEYFLKQGEKASINGTLFNFGTPETADAFNIKYEKEQLTFLAGTTFIQTQMATQKTDTLSPGMHRPLLLRSLYASGSQKFVFGEFVPHGRMEVTSTADKMTNSSVGGLHINLGFGGEEKEIFVYGRKGMEGSPQIVTVGGANIAVSYGAKRVTLPFSIKLHDFIMERYPGTNSASSYASEVTLNDPRANVIKDQKIYMNHILNYDGYRFFQSSFDQDELGTYLSVNHDFWGTKVSYLGYALLTIGMVLTFFSGKSRFRQLGNNIKKMRAAEKVLTILLINFFMPFSQQAYSNSVFVPSSMTVDMEHAKAFGRILMQDYKGRIKPMNTFSNEVLRKLSRKETLYGQTAEQIILHMLAFPKDWYGVPLIKTGKEEEIKKILGTNEELIAYKDFFLPNGEYKLKDYVRNAYTAEPKERGTFEKAILKLDEKVNICSMIFSGRFLKVFPVAGDPNNQWRSPGEHDHSVNSEGTFMEKFYPAYVNSLQNAMQQNDWDLANRLWAELAQYQTQNGGAILPSPTKLKAEILLNRLSIFSTLGKMYAFLGMTYLVFLFTIVFNPKLNLDWPAKIAGSILVLCFVLYTFGLGLRWYVSGRAPWSNGYESMIYIGWTTMLAGLIFARKSFGGLAATCILSTTILMVAGLSWLDPEITPLVPVLKSYWLTIHVSMEAGSYGFLMLGAIIGVLNLIFMILKNQKNGIYVDRVVKEMTMVSEMTLIGGLFMISIGTYLGGVWANESWGRYWGWDAKETWALVTILIYAFILHMRFIPGLRSAFAFNVATLFGWASVMMTYFGVNYYLSGLHSYAAGDPVPIPSFVYYTVMSLVAISLLAYWRNRHNRLQAVH